MGKFTIPNPTGPRWSYRQRAERIISVSAWQLPLYSRFKRRGQLSPLLCSALHCMQFWPVPVPATPRYPHKSLWPSSSGTALPGASCASQTQCICMSQLLLTKRLPLLATRLVKGYRMAGPGEQSGWKCHRGMKTDSMEYNHLFWSFADNVCPFFCLLGLCHLCAF